MPVPLYGVAVSDAGGLSPEGRSLLESLESFRDILSRRLVQEQVTLPDPDLNSIVISSILEALFLRTGQDRGFIAPDTLGLLAESDGIGKRMGRACSDAGLLSEKFFDAGVDGPRPLPEIPDSGLRTMIDRVVSAEFPVPITVIEPEELAAVFEYFVGMRLEGTGGCRVKKTGKSTVLYTGSIDVPPRALVQEIVRVTLRGIVRDPPQEKSPAILDPACGAGIFLLAAYRFLSGDGGAPGLQDLSDRACQSLFGVDLDPESVSAARFVILLACIEDIGNAGMIVTTGHVRGIATILTRNIRCGNSVIAPDYFAGRPVHPFNADERRRVSPFDWDTAFPAVFNAGGFDAILGAPPPYQPFPVPAREAYFQTHYATYAPSAGLSGYFIEKALSLLRPGGAMGILIPGTFLRARHARGLRRLILTRQIETLADTGRTRQMQGGAARLFFLMLSNRPPERPFLVLPVAPGERFLPDAVHGSRGFLIDQRSLGDGGWILEDTRAGDLLKRLMRAATPLDHFIMGEFVVGENRIRNNPLVITPETREDLAKRPWCRRFFVPLLRSADIGRYVPAGPSRFVIKVKNKKRLRKCRALEQYLEHAPWPDGTPGKDEKSGGPGFFPVDRPAAGMQSPDTVPKIIFGAFQHTPAFAYDPAGSFAITTSLVAIPRPDPVLVAILNSSLGRFIIAHTCPVTDRGYNLGPLHLGKFPVIAPDFDRLPEKNRHARIAALVTQVLALHAYLRNVKTSQERRLIRQEIDAIEVKIDAGVYELYGLTRDEIVTVEESVV